MNQQATMSRKQFADFLKAVIFPAIEGVREAGQVEYVHDEGDAFGNFKRTGADIGIPREKVLWIFAKKHLDGIASHLQGNTSQREDVRGRIKYAALYLFLLWGMVEVDKGSQYKAPDVVTTDQGLFALGVDKSLNSFMVKMREKLFKHSDRGLSWKGGKFEDLMDGLDSEVVEMKEAYDASNLMFDIQKLDNIIYECADIANYAMMISELCESQKEEVRWRADGK